MRKTESYLRNIEELLNKENRAERLKALETENQLLHGRMEKIEDKLKALEKHLGVDYVKQSKYIKYANS